MSHTDHKTDAKPAKEDPIHRFPSSPISPLLDPPQTSFSDSSNSDLFSTPNSNVARRSLSSTTTSRSSSDSSFNSIINTKFPMGNIYPNGVPKRSQVCNKPDQISGAKCIPEEYDYGCGSLISRIKRCKDLIKSGNGEYNKGRHNEALVFYRKAVKLYPKNVTSRMHCVDALVELRRFNEAISECEEVIKYDPINGCVYHHLTLISLRMGLIEPAKEYITLTPPHTQKDLYEKLRRVDEHLRKAEEARKNEDYETAAKEIDASIIAGADLSKYILAFKAEMLLHEHKFEQADETLSKASELEISFPKKSDTSIFPSQANHSFKFMGMLPDSYFSIVQARIDIVFGRFFSAVKAVDKAHISDPSNTEVRTVRKNVKLASWAHQRGNEFYEKEKYVQAIDWFKEGLKHDKCSFSLWCNLADCFFELKRWEKCVESCNETLRIKPNCAKALIRRAGCFFKLEKWEECVRDYETVLKDFEGDAEINQDEINQTLVQSKLALTLEKMRDDVNSKFRREVEDITNLEQFNEAIITHGSCVVYFMDRLYDDVSSFFDSLSDLYPPVHFIKVDIQGNEEIAKNNNVKAVPTFKIYENGKMVKEMIDPSRRDLESSVMNYCV